MDRTCGKSGSFKDTTKTLLLKNQKELAGTLGIHNKERRLGKFNTHMHIEGKFVQMNG